MAEAERVNDYVAAEQLGLTKIDRWGNSVPHRPMSKRLMNFSADYDLIENGDHFNWKTGGDGDNGEILMFEMDAFFELLDKQAEKRG